MLYENIIPYYSTYEEDKFLRQMDTFNQHKSNPFYYNPNIIINNNKRKDFSSTSSSSSFFPTPTNNAMSKKIIHSTDALSFCHTIYITVKKRRNTPSDSPSPSPDYTHQSAEESQLLLLPDICCTIPASKLSSKAYMISNIISIVTLSLVNLPSY